MEIATSNTRLYNTQTAPPPATAWGGAEEWQLTAAGPANIRGGWIWEQRIAIARLPGITRSMPQRCNQTGSGDSGAHPSWGSENSLAKETALGLRIPKQEVKACDSPENGEQDVQEQVKRK